MAGNPKGFPALAAFGVLDAHGSQRKVEDVFSARASLWSAVSGAVLCVLLAAGVYLWFPTTTSHVYSSAAFMPTQFDVWLERANRESVSVEVVPGSSTLELSSSSAGESSLIVPASLLPDAALALASAGASVSWPSDVPVASTIPAPGPVQVESPLLGFLRYLLLSALILGAAFCTVAAVRRRGHRAASFRSARTPSTRFSDIAGVPEAVQDMQEVVHYLKDSSALASLGAAPPRGVLLVGPPGTGKTLLARAVAAEADASFFTISGSDLMEKYVGVGASRVRSLFAQARKHAPSIVFIDELDAVGKSRSDSDLGHAAESDHTLIALLTELDGFHARDRVVVIGATNRPDVLDGALTRAGRLEHRVDVPLPDRPGRESILQVASRGVPWSADVDLASVASRTPGFSGAQLRRVVNEAARHAARRQSAEVSSSDVDAALSTVMVGRARHSALVTERDRQVSAWHEAGHAAAALLLSDMPNPVSASIVPRGSTGGVTWLGSTDDEFFTRSEAFARMVVAMAGRAGEQLGLNGDFTQGASHDLETATALAESMVARLGMVESVRSVRRPLVSGAYDRDVICLVDSLVARATEVATQILGRHSVSVAAVAQGLLDDESLDQEQLCARLGMCDVYSVVFDGGAGDLDVRVTAIDTVGEQPCA